MLIEKRHYNTMKEAMDLVMERYVTVTPEIYKNKGLSEKRYRWDLFNLCSQNCLLPEGFVTEDLYWYCNDDHIDTALRKITKTK